MSQEVVNMQLSDIHIDEDFNSRGKIIPMDVVSLAQDIDRVGLIQPVIVMAYNEDERTKYGFKYKLLAGFRRTFAHKVLNRATIPAIIHERMCDVDATIFNLSENLNRADLTILQEARTMRRLSTYAYTEEQIAAKIGKSRGWVQVRLMLLQLPEVVQAEVEAGFINQTQIRKLYTIYRASGQAAVFDAVKEIKDAKLSGRRPLVVDPNKKKITAKRVRTRSEIIVCLENMYDVSGAGLHTRGLAWASGEISDAELWLSVKEYCATIGKPFVNPLQV